MGYRERASGHKVTRLGCAIVWAAIVLPAPSWAMGPDQVTVDISNVIRSDMRNAIGINLDYLLDNDSQCPAGSPRLAQVLAANGLRCLRYPGGEKSDNYLWTTRSRADARPIRPEDPVPSPLVPRAADAAYWPSMDKEIANPDRTLAKPPLDFDSFMALCAEAHAEPVIVVAYDSAREIHKRGEGNSLDDLVASAAAWVKYAKAKGYRVRWWEIGNETDGKVVSPSLYVEHFKRFAAAMRAQDPDVKIAAQAGLEAVLADGCADGVVAHSYPMYRWDRGYDDFLTSKSITSELDSTLNLTRGHNKGGRPIPIVITEFNATDWSGSWPNVNDLGHALVVFDMIGQQVSHPEVALTTLWNTRFPGPHGYKAATGPNLVVNPRFEDGLKGWNNGGEVVDDGSVRKALRVAGGGWIYQDFPVSPGDLRYFSCWAKVTDSTPWAAVGIDFIDDQEKPISLAFFRSEQIQWADWHLVHQSFKVPDKARKMRIWFLESKGDASLLVKDVRLDNSYVGSELDTLADDNSLRPSGEALSLWTRHVRDNLLRTTGTERVRVYASSDRNGLTIWLLNKPNQKTEVRFDLRNYTARGLAKAWQFTGTLPEDIKPHTVKLPDVPFNQPTVGLTLPPLSITVLSLAQH